MNILRQRIPTILGLLLLLGGITGGVYLVQKGGIWFLKAEPTTVPKQIRITNITDTDFTVSWITEEGILGFVKYGITPSLKKTAVDERDELSGKTAPYSIHQVKVLNLTPGTKYYFKIGSGKRLFDNNGKLYEVTTAPTLGVPPPADAGYGTILKSDGSPAEGVIVYLSLANSIPLSALTKSGGSWTIPLSVARMTNLSSYITYDPDASIEELFIQGGSLGTATAIVTTKNDSPVPTITLGKSYDFRETKTELELEPTASPASKFFLEPVSTPSVVKEEELTIINPEEEEKVATQKPEIRGTGPSGKKLEITLESPETFTAEIMINEDGSWSWTPPSDLPPGEHTITVTLDDGTRVARSFTILAAGEGELPAFTATPSGEATPSPTASPTATPTATPTAVPRQAMPSTEEGVPEAGYLTPTITFVILGIVLIFTGLFVNYKTSLYG